MGGSASKVEKEVAKEFKARRSQSYNLNYISQDAFDQDSDESLGLAWRTLGAKPGLSVWIADGKADDVRGWPAEAVGTFSDGDSFVVLKTHKKGVHAIHLWVGARSDDDEMAVGMRIQIYMDRHFQRMGHAVTLYHETQGNESEVFRSYFTPPMAVVLGGFLGVSRPIKRKKRKSDKKKKKTGKSLEEQKKKDSQTRLFRVTGGDSTSVIEVPPQPRWLNHGDAFVLSAGLRVFNFSGKDANERERLRADQVCHQIATDYEEAYESKVALNSVKGFESDSKEAEEFWDLLGGKPKSISKLADEYDSSVTTVYSVEFGADIADDVTFKKAGESACFNNYTPLDHASVFVCDTGSIVYAWVGCNAARAVRTHAISIARQFFKEKGKNPAAVVSRVCMGSESDHFKSIFQVEVEVPEEPAADPNASSQSLATAESKKE